MLTEERRRQRAALARYMAADVPAPIDALNLISLAPDPRPYFRYGRYVFPLALAYSARWVLCAKHVESVHGPVTADDFVVCRYRTHRHFFRMVRNPYYAFANRFRMAGGLRHVEIGLAHQFAGAEPIGPLTAHNRRLVLVQYADRGDGRSHAELVKVMADLPGHLVYAARQVMSIEALAGDGPPAPHDPRPLSFSGFLVWQAADFTAARAFFASGDALRAMASVTASLAVDLYWRVRLTDLPRTRPVDLPDGRVDPLARARAAAAGS